MSSLILVRHGESTWNLERRLQGQTMDVPLTQLGLAQAATAAETVAQLVPPLTPVWTSDQLRAQQTASPIATRLGVIPYATALLREQGLGTLEGKSYDELAEEPVPAGQHIAEVGWGGGESLLAVYQRCTQLLPLLPAGDVVLVGHGDSLRVLLTALQGRSHREIDFSFSFTNGQVLALPRTAKPGATQGS